MTVLSERELTGQLGKGILLHPLKPGTIKACNICLTASEYAYAIGKDERLPIKTLNPNSSREKKYFEIPPKDTTLVWTDESIWLSSYLCSTVHSTVNLASKGIGHIGTRVNPCWVGALCIAFHNLSDSPHRIYVKDTTEPIAYLMVHRLSSKSSIKKSKMDTPARLDVLQGRENATEIRDWYNNSVNSWKSDKDLLENFMLNSTEYRNLKSGGLQLWMSKSGGLQLWMSSYIGSDQMTRWTAVIAIITVINFLVTAISLFW